MKKNNYPVTNIGSVSLLMTFIVLCLSIFAVLSLSGAVSEYQYSQKLAQHTQDYYQATNLATTTLQDIDQILHTAYINNPDTYYATIQNELAAMEQIDADFDTEQPSITYEIPINDSQALRVILALNPPDQTEDGYYRITTWQKVSSSQWNADDSLHLMPL